MADKNRLAKQLCVISGLLLFFSGTSGATVWKLIENLFSKYVSDLFFIHFLFGIIITIASLGGIAVIFGAIFIDDNKIFIGKILIALGAGAGVIGLIVSLVLGIMTKSLHLTWFFSAGTIGIILSVIARVMVK